MAFILSVTPVLRGRARVKPARCELRESVGVPLRRARARVCACVHMAGGKGEGGGEEEVEVEVEEEGIRFRPHAGTGEDMAEEAGDFVPVDLVDGYLDNARVRPKIDIDADEYMLMWKLRKMLHEDDFNRIFDKNSRRIGEF